MQTTIDANRIGYRLKGWAYWVSQNEDGTLTVSNDGVTSFKNAGSLIITMGGIDATLAACDKEPVTADDYRKHIEESIRFARDGEIPTEEEKQKRLVFVEHLIAESKNHYFGIEHTPTTQNRGFRFGMFGDIRFDSVKGWQKMRKGSGWMHVSELSHDVIKTRIECGLPAYEPKEDEAEKYREHYEKVVKTMGWAKRRNQEIKSAYDAIKDLRPVPANIENITAILRYYKMEESVGELLPMTIGYSCNGYDCDGKYAVAIKLDRPIVYNEDGDMSDRFVCGAPHGHLVKYTRI